MFLLPLLATLLLFAIPSFAIDEGRSLYIEGYAGEISYAPGDDFTVGVLVAGLWLPAGPPTRGAAFIERFSSQELGGLNRSETRLGIVGALNSVGILIDDDAVDALVDLIRGYPWFLQLYGQETWRAWRRRAVTGPITIDDVRHGERAARTTVDRAFRERFSRLPPSAQTFLIAAAQNADAAGQFRIGEVVETLGLRDQRQLSPARADLINHHQLIVPVGSGRLRLVLPHFADWLRRVAATEPHAVPPTQPPPARRPNAQR